MREGLPIFERTQKWASYFLFDYLLNVKTASSQVNLQGPIDIRISLPVLEYQKK